MNLLSKVLYNKLAKISKEPGRRPVGILAHWCWHSEKGLLLEQGLNLVIHFKWTEYSRSDTSLLSWLGCKKTGSVLGWLSPICSIGQQPWCGLPWEPPRSLSELTAGIPQESLQLRSQPLPTPCLQPCPQPWLWHGLPTVGLTCPQTWLYSWLTEIWEIMC